MNTERYFRHFKGGLYQLIGYAFDSETLEEMVIYQALYGDHKVWVRPKNMFFEDVVLDNNKIPRFQELTKKEILCLSQIKKENT